MKEHKERGMWTADQRLGASERTDMTYSENLRNISIMKVTIDDRPTHKSIRSYFQLP